MSPNNNAQYSKEQRPKSRGGRGNDYNPNHPDADWSGFVPAKVCKKQFNSPKNNRKNSNDVPAALKVQITCMNDEDGKGGTTASFLGPKKDASTNEWNKPGRRMSTSSPSPSKGFRSSTFSLIGGPSPPPSSASSPRPSSAGCNHRGNASSSQWETESQAMSNQKGTTITQMTERRRSVHVRGRRATAPPFVNKQQRTFDTQRAHVIRNENPYRLNGDPSPIVSNSSSTSNNNNFPKRHEQPQRQRQPPKKEKNTVTNNNQNLIGYRAKPLMSSSNQSFLSNISKDLPSSSSFCSSNSTKQPQQPQQQQKRHHHVVVAPYATDGNLPTDPYASSSSSNRRTSKDLLRENYSSQVPGYTGKRTFL